MIDFKEISLADKDWMQELFGKANYNSEEYNFTFSFIWRGIFNSRVARMNDYLLYKSIRHDTASYLYPPGCGDVKPVIDALMEDARQNGHTFKFHTVLAEQVKVLETLYPGKFEFFSLDNYFDYVYDAQSLITLAGKKLHGKRNHINRFIADNPDWSYEPITPDNLPDCVAMSREWCMRHGCSEEPHLRDETRAVHQALDHYFSLDMQGGLIRAGGRVVAFSMGERLNSDTYLVHIEKAFSDVQGAYAIINQKFAETNCQDYLYINREDDSGQEGLRKAKLSYRPVMMVEKYAAILKEDYPENP
ncbi:phosphatidylglycerol lysyltransferase domain-containing protein [Oscillospiraceae bacterium MB08-C2-2]|nr:phosphatidylglycerol lysyltransferase domain-containing protein [Oscillospiraceae bacterium MB08-C2-2]